MAGGGTPFGGASGNGQDGSGGAGGGSDQLVRWSIWGLPISWEIGMPIEGTGIRSKTSKVAHHNAVQVHKWQVVAVDSDHQAGPETVIKTMHPAQMDCRD